MADNYIDGNGNIKIKPNTFMPGADLVEKKLKETPKEDLKKEMEADYNTAKEASKGNKVDSDYKSVSKAKEGDYILRDGKPVVLTQSDIDWAAEEVRKNDPYAADRAAIEAEKAEDEKRREARKNMTAEERLAEAQKEQSQSFNANQARAESNGPGAQQSDANTILSAGNELTDVEQANAVKTNMSQEEIEKLAEADVEDNPDSKAAIEAANEMLESEETETAPAPKVEETKEPEAPAASATQEEVDNAEKELEDNGVDPSNEDSLVRAVEKSGLGELVMTKDGTYVFKPHFMTRDEWAEETGNSSGRFWDWLTVGSMAITCLTAYLSDGAFAVPPFNFRAMDRDKQSYDAYLGNVQNLASDFNSVLTSAYSETAEAKIEEGEDNKGKLDEHATSEGKREAEKAKYLKGQELAYQKALGKYQKDLEITLQDALADIDVDKDARLGDNQVDTVKKTLQAKLEDEYKRLNKVSELTHDEKNAISWLVDAKSGLSTMAEQEQVENAHKSVGNIVNGAAEIVDAIMPF